MTEDTSYLYTLVSCAQCVLVCTRVQLLQTGAHW